MDAIMEPHSAADQRQRVARLAEAYAGQVREHFGPRVHRIRLYGSAVRGDWTPESDIDVLVTLDDVSPEDADWLSAQAFHMGMVGTGLLLQPVFMAEKHFAHLLARERAFALAVEREGPGTMTADNARDNARDEAKRGDEALAAAKVLLSAGFFNDAISRAYYAAFHWARALLVSQGNDPKTHRGVIQMVSLNFVTTRKLTEEEAAILAQLETYREISDYAPAADFTEPIAAAEIEKAGRFIAACRRLLAT